MTVLLLLAVLCCLGVIGLSGMMVYAVRRRRSVPIAFQRVGSSMHAMAHVPMPLFLHPRMDLASGRAPQNQAVDLERRHNRQECSETLGCVPVASAAHVFEPFAQRRRHATHAHERLDRVYARETMGDLSDPVAGTGWRLPGAALPAK